MNQVFSYFFSLGDRRIRIHTFDIDPDPDPWAQKHVDPDSDPDPQHWWVVKNAYFHTKIH